MLQGAINQLLQHITEKESSKDYDLNVLLNEWEGIVNSCTSQKELDYLKEQCGVVKNNGTIGNFLAGKFLEKANSRKLEPEKEFKRAKFLYYENGKVSGLESSYHIDSGIRTGNKALRAMIPKMQLELGIMEAKKYDENIPGFVKKFGKYVDEALLACENEQDINNLKSFLEKMSSLGYAGKLAYEQFDGSIALDNKPKALMRERRRQIEENQKAKRKNMSGISETKEENEAEFDAILREYDEVDSNKSGIDDKVLRDIYYRGQALLVEARRSGREVTKKMLELQRRQDLAKETIETLDENYFDEI